MNRRRFVYSSAAVGLTAAVTPRAFFAQAPTIMDSKPIKPVVISSANGNKFKNGGDMTCVQKAFTLMTQGTDVLDALIAGVNIVELDPLDDSVGYGGLPNADGVVQLDSCCMHGPKKRAGGVACIEGVRTPSLVAKATPKVISIFLWISSLGVASWIWAGYSAISKPCWRPEPT